METKTAVIYSRVSSSGYQVNRQDTSRQIKDLQAYANYSQVKVMKVFEEHISGAKRNDERPADSKHPLGGVLRGHHQEEDENPS